MKIAVTGATGFLGGALVRQLQRNGHDVIGLGRNSEAGARLASEGIRFDCCDLVDLSALKKSFSDVDTVIHCAALSQPWGKRKAFESANVIGTQNVVDACSYTKIQRLIHLSSPSVCFDTRPKEDVKETEPVVETYLNHYIRTKIQAENIVKQSNVPAIMFRPRAIFGVGDTTILPRIIESLQAGKLPIIGDGENRVNLSYIDNVVDCLASSVDFPLDLSGRIYNLHDGEVVNLWQEIEFIADQLGLSIPRRKLSLTKAYSIANVVELIYRGLPFLGEPRLTRYTVSVLGQTQTLSIDAAKRDLNYCPKVSTRQGLTQFVEGYRKTKDLRL